MTDQETREGLKLVAKVAWSMFAPNGPYSPEDLLAFGALGLVEAARNFDAEKARETGTTFSSYAVWRIRGAIQDAIRCDGRLPRTAHTMLRKYYRKRGELWQQTGAMPTLEQIAALIDEDPVRILAAIRAASAPVPLDEPDGDSRTFDTDPIMLAEKVADDAPGPLDLVLEADSTDELWRHVDELPPRESYVVRMYTQGDMNLREIADTLGVTESRVSQLWTKACNRLRARLEGSPLAA